MMSARLNENRSFLFSQMETTEDIISSISENLKFSYSKTMTRDLCAALDKYDVNYSTAIAYYNQNERLIIEIYTKNAEQEDAEAISDILSCELRVPMEFSEPVSCSGETRLRFNQQTKYKIQYASAQSSAEENQLQAIAADFSAMVLETLMCLFLTEWAAEVRRQLIPE